MRVSRAPGVPGAVGAAALLAACGDDGGSGGGEGGAPAEGGEGGDEEESTGTGTARYVDSSIERVQVRVLGGEDDFVGCELGVEGDARIGVVAQLRAHELLADPGNRDDCGYGSVVVDVHPHALGQVGGVDAVVSGGGRVEAGDRCRRFGGCLALLGEEGAHL